MTFRHARRSIITSVYGKRTVRGSAFTTNCTVISVRPKDGNGSPVRPLLIANRSKRLKNGPHGYDAGKKVNGRKRHVLVDTLGLIIAVVVHCANIQDRDGAKLVLHRAKDKIGRLQLIWGDGGYAGKLLQWVTEFCSAVRFSSTHVP